MSANEFEKAQEEVMNVISPKTHKIWIIVYSTKD